MRLVFAVLLLACATVPHVPASVLAADDADATAERLVSVSEEDLDQIVRAAILAEFADKEPSLATVYIVNPGVTGDWIPTLPGWDFVGIAAPDLKTYLDRDEQCYLFRDFQLERGYVNVSFVRQTREGKRGTIYRCECEDGIWVVTESGWTCGGG